MAHFQNEKFFFRGQILQQIEIRSCSNGVCCSWGISFRWHFWHILFLVSNNLIMKNKVLSYHKLNSGKNSIAADYLHFPSHKNTNILFFSLLFLEFWWYFQFLECIATISKPMKIFKMRRYGIIKLSKLNITWQTALKNFYHHHLCACAKPFWVVLKIGLDLEKFFLQNGFWNTPPNSMKFHKFHGTEQNKSFPSDYE